MDTPSLKDSPTQTVITNLGKLASSTVCMFTCGGTVTTDKTVLIFYKKENGKWSPKPPKLPLPSTDDHHVLDLISIL